MPKVAFCVLIYRIHGSCASWKLGKYREFVSPETIHDFGKFSHNVQGNTPRPFKIEPYMGCNKLVLS